MPGTGFHRLVVLTAFLALVVVILGAYTSLTDAGRTKLESAPEPLQAEFLREFRKLEDWEQQMLKSSLLRIARMMDAQDIDAAPILQAGAIVEVPKDT